MAPASGPDTPLLAALRGGRRRIMVLVEPGRAAVAAVDLARDLAEEGEATVTLLAVAPRAPVMSGCGPSGRDYDAAVCESVADDLRRAGEMLRSLGSSAACRLLVEGSDPSLEEFVARERFDVVLLPGRRRPLRPSRHPAAARLARSGVTVRIINGR